MLASEHTLARWGHPVAPVFILLYFKKMNGTQPKTTSSGSWEVDILERLCGFYSRAAKCGGTVISLPFTPTSSLSSFRWPAVVQPSRLSLHPFLWPELWGSYKQKVIRWELGVGEWTFGWCLNTRNNLNGPRTHTHTHTQRLEGWSQVTPNLSHSGELKRSGYSLWRGALSVQTHTLKVTQTERDRICPLSPHLSLTKLDSVFRAVCSVWL